MNFKLPGRIYSSIARHAVYRLSHDLSVPQQLAARDSSARFIANSMLDSIALDSRPAIIAAACEQAAELDGCFCEFGVYRGESLRLLAKHAPSRKIHGFDSFKGLPERWRHGFGTSMFKTSMPNLRNSNIKLHVGLFEDTLPGFIGSLEENISLAHIDCDLYSSTRTVLDLIAPKLADGAILVFDEYFNYPGWEDHEHRALTESVEAGALEIEYIAYNGLGEQVMVQASTIRRK